MHRTTIPPSPTLPDDALRLREMLVRKHFQELHTISFITGAGPGMDFPESNRESGP
ncbi:homoserine O-succinyltransferase [Anopheles sinensis]|uniref:Homoserine O-succinyltransferase n=1 Tax=Anopheles sinensis TaxID=74873 RepID=A0A084VMM8_ANOSI|nr:homoserine O-succinyltransferase [Anopheles sinensis]